MELYTIENDQLKLVVNRVGAEMTELWDKKKNQNVLWHGKDHWNNHAPVLFPIVGGLIDDTYFFNEKSYTLKRHGFARYNECFDLKEKSETHISFCLIYSEETKEVYPFEFELIVEFVLIENKVNVNHYVRNKGEKEMIYSIGGHPAFCLSDDINDYQLVFEKEESFEFPILNVNGQRTNDMLKFSDPSNQIQINTGSFEKDAWIYERMNSSWVELKSSKSDLSIRLYKDDFIQFGIWSKPGAPFVCLEPWLGIADYEGHNQKLVEKEGILFLESGEMSKHKYSIELY